MGVCFGKKNPNHLASYDPMNIVSNEDGEITYSLPRPPSPIQVYSPSSSSILRWVKKRRADRYYNDH